MITLHGGPAEGIYAVQRAPVLLRAVVGPDDKKDILNERADRPRGDERIAGVYLMRRTAGQFRVGQVHINRGGRGSGFYALADYDWLEGVDGEALRDEENWVAWVRGYVEGLDAIARGSLLENC